MLYCDLKFLWNGKKTVTVKETCRENDENDINEANFMLCLAIEIILTAYFCYDGIPIPYSNKNKLIKRRNNKYGTVCFSLEFPSEEESLNFISEIPQFFM